MGRLNVLGKFLIFAAFAVGSANAVAATQFTVSGDITSYVDHGTSTSLPGGTFSVVIVYDDSVTPVNTYNMNGISDWRWDNSIVSVSYTISDGTSDLYSRSFSLDATTTTDWTKTHQTSNMETLDWRLINSASGLLDGVIVGFSETGQTLFTDASMYPDPNGLIGHQGTLAIRGLDTSKDHDYTVHGTITNVSVGPADTDGDGIPDDQDSCPNSDLSSTVTVNGNDTGVTNSLQSNGCTIMDLIAGVSSPRKMAHVLDRLEDSGVITKRQMGEIVRAAAKHHGHHRVRKHHSWDHHSADRDRDHHSGDRDHDHH